MNSIASASFRFHGAHPLDHWRPFDIQSAQPPGPSMPSPAEAMQRLRGPGEPLKGALGGRLTLHSPWKAMPPSSHHSWSFVHIANSCVRTSPPLNVLSTACSLSSSRSQVPKLPAPPSTVHTGQSSSIHKHANPFPPKRLRSPSQQVVNANTLSCNSVGLTLQLLPLTN